MGTWQDTEQTSEPVTIHPHYWRWLGLMFLLCLLGIIISVRVPVWLAPPYTHRTPWLYLPVIFAWLILLIVLALTHRLNISGWDKFRIGFVVVVETLALFAIVLWWSLFSFDCSPATITDGTAHYSCNATIQAIVPATDYSGNTVQPWQFQGPSNSPVVSLIHTATH